MVSYYLIESIIGMMMVKWYLRSPEFMALDPRDVIKLFDFETGYPRQGTGLPRPSLHAVEREGRTVPHLWQEDLSRFYQVFTATKTSTYYIKDEIRHLMFYYPTIIYGTPKCFKI